MVLTEEPRQQYLEYVDSMAETSDLDGLLTYEEWLEEEIHEFDDTTPSLLPEYVQNLTGEHDPESLPRYEEWLEEILGELWQEHGSPYL